MDSQKIESAPDETEEEREGHDRRDLPEGSGLVRAWIDVLVPSIYTGNRHTDGKLLRSTTGDHRASRQRRR